MKIEPLTCALGAGRPKGLRGRGRKVRPLDP